MLEQDVYEDFLIDMKNNSFREVAYMDIWDYEDEYSHNEIEIARGKFVDMANAYLKVNNFPYLMRQVNENAYVCDLDGAILRIKQ